MKMSRCLEDVKMRRCFTDPHYWKNPALRRSREKNNRRELKKPSLDFLRSKMIKNERPLEFDGKNS